MNTKIIVKNKLIVSNTLLFFLLGEQRCCSR